MRKLKFRMGATAAAAGIAVTTAITALALQQDNPSTGPSSTTQGAPIADEPIRYAGGYGLFPTVR